MKDLFKFYKDFFKSLELKEFIKDEVNEMLEFLRAIFGCFSDPEVYKDKIEDVSKNIVLEVQDEVEDEPVVNLNREAPIDNWSEEAMRAVTKPSKFFK